MTQSVLPNLSLERETLDCYEIVAWENIFLTLKFPALTQPAFLDVKIDTERCNVCNVGMHDWRFLHSSVGSYPLNDDENGKKALNIDEKTPTNAKEFYSKKKGGNLFFFQFFARFFRASFSFPETDSESHHRRGEWNILFTNAYFQPFFEVSLSRSKCNFLDCIINALSSSE